MDQPSHPPTTPICSPPPTPARTSTEAIHIRFGFSCTFRRFDAQHDPTSSRIQHRRTSNAPSAMAHLSSTTMSGASYMDRSISSTSSAHFSASSSPGMATSVVASDLASNDDNLSAMDEESVSMPATPPDASHMGHVHILDSAASAATSSINATAQPVKKPELFLSITRANRPKLVLSPTDQERFTEHIQESKKKFASDTAYLPKSTNMGLSDVDAAALLSVNPFNFARPNAQSWEDDDVDVDHGRTRAAAKPGKTVFMNAFPCIFVSNLTNSISFYQKLLGFSPIGKPASHQAVLRRGPAARPPRSSSQPYSAIPSAAEEPGVRIVLRYLPAEWGELKGDGSGPPQLLIVVSNVDELFQEIVTKQQQFKPNGREYFPEVFLGKAKLIGKPQNKPWGTRELHVLDPDGNKIIFYHELN